MGTTTRTSSGMGGTAPRASLSKVFVEVPSSRTLLKHTPHVSSTGHKENALSRSSTSHMRPSTPPAQAHNKRKPDIDVPVVDGPATKKHKDTFQQPAANMSDEYPNGFVYCHQCNKKRDATITVRCTAKDRKGRRCSAKYCKPCLKNRYGLFLEDILADDRTDLDNHVQDEGYHFRCPRCSDTCNCVACRKSKGLQPTGNLANTARQSGLTSAADVLRQNPKAAGSMANKPGEETKQHRSLGVVSETNTSKSLSMPGTKQLNRSSKLETKSKAKSVPQAKLKAFFEPNLLVKPVWTSVGTALTQCEAEERINIREFALRFSSVLGLSRSHLDELDEIRPSRTRNIEDEDDESIPWISEACLKSLLLGLLNMVDTKGDREKHLKATIKSIRESGAHLNKIWAALATLRERQEKLSCSAFSLSFPDPLPPPEPVLIIRTRSGANQFNTGSINVLRTAQLVPVISAFVGAAVESEVARQELEAGFQESKERIKDAREAHRIENERFEHEKESQRTTGKRLDKLRTEHHKRTMAVIDDALKIVSYAYVPRISPLGRDIDGRIYWALTPGMNEREDALETLQSCLQGRAHKPKSRRKPLVPSEDERGALRKWSWFVAVWGKRPPTTERTLEDDDDSQEEEEEGWWGFWEPDEIMKLASWVHYKVDLEEGVCTPSGSRTLFPDSDVEMEDRTDDEYPDYSDDIEGYAIPTRGEITTLARELEQYASLLQRRLQKCE